MTELLCEGQLDRQLACAIEIYQSIKVLILDGMAKKRWARVKENRYFFVKRFTAAVDLNKYLN